ncbi:expressed unknown protein [Seminavis robusta]|uniref:Uncharacterized protein n=1 Tax=Seminavis robusta TaxID=568900 RepID=A0A9N8DYE3_9STRA|nr:expressed unknown protein [Seminavis robusta]|eukprot:Sro367_g127720.1 n/a (136) ;mRNA; f:8880-9287
MAAIDQHTHLEHPAASPYQEVEGFLPQQEGPQSSIRITRFFEVRRVHSSATELRLSMDVPAGVSLRDLHIHVGGLCDNKNKKNQNCTLCVSQHGGSTGRAFSLNAQSVDLANLTAVLNHDELQIIAPKHRRRASV